MTRCDIPRQVCLEYFFAAHQSRGDGTRTRDLLVPNQTRYQLRYASKKMRSAGGHEEPAPLSRVWRSIRDSEELEHGRPITVPRNPGKTSP